MPKVLGDVAIVIRPSTTGFRQLADAQLRRDLAGFRPQVQIGADTKMARVAVADLKARMEAMRVSLKGMRADVDTKAGEAKIAALQARLSLLIKNMTGIPMSADTKRLDAQIAGEIAKLRTLQQRYSKIQLDADASKVLSRIADLELAGARLEKRLKTMKGDLNVKAAQAKLTSIKDELVALNSDKNTLRLKADKKSALADIAVVEASITRLRAEAADIKLNADAKGLLAAQAGLLGIESAMEKLRVDAPVAAKGMNVFFATSGRASTASAAGWKILTGHVALFGGALNTVLPKMFTSVAVWHLLADAVIELIAVWVPAIIAVTAFGVAGADAGKKIYQRMVAVHTVMDATGQAVPPLTNNFKHLAAAVRPEVYQLFGDALVIMSKRGGAFNQVALGTGRVLDQLAARFVVAVTSGKGVNKFMENAVNDVQKLGDSIGNFGGIFGSVFRAVPGYAEILLTVGDAITRVLEVATRGAEPVIAFGLALHGFFIYGGAAVTMSLALVAGLVKLFGAFGKFNAAVTLVGFNALKKFGLAIAGGIANLVTYSAMLLEVAGAEGIAAARSVVLSDAMSVLGKIPIMVWITLAAVALTSLAIAIARSKDEAQKFNGTMQDLITNAPIGNVITTIQAAQASTAARLAESTGKLNAAIKTNTVVNAGRAGTLNSNGTAIQNLDNATRHYTEGQARLDAQSRLVTTRVGILSKTYHGNTQALGVLNAAGITTAQLTAKGANAWDIIKVQVEATTRAYRAMGSQAGVLGNDLDVMGRTMTDQYQAIQKLNQGWTAFITDVTGTQSAFDTVAQGFFTLRDHAGKLTFSLGKLKVKYADQKAAIDSLTPAGIALNQAFGDQVQNVDKLFASWRTAGISGKQFTSGVQAAIGPLVKYAAGSQEATAQLVALAEEAGYQGPISLQALTKWLGNTHGATQRLKDITNQATAQEALLTGAMQAQGNYISNTLLRDIANAALNYYGVQKAVIAYGTAVAQSGKDSDNARGKMNAAIAGIVKSEQAVGDNTTQMAAVVAKTFGISMPAAVKKVKAALTDTLRGLPAGQKAFESFAINGLGLTADKAGSLWKKFSQSNLGALAGKADTTRDKFDKLAAKGLGITRDQADLLWLHLRKQYLDTLGAKTDIAHDKFIKLAEQGLGYTRDKAQKLWDTLHHQQLVDAATKADATRAAFEKFAAKLGYSKDQADKLWTSLRRLTASGYSVSVKVDAQGLVNVNGYKISAGAYFSPHAAGGFISGGTPNQDSVPAMLMPGEVVVPTNMVRAGAVDHLRGALPGFAAGGAVSHLRKSIPGFAYGGKVAPGSRVGDTGDLTTNFPMQSFDAIGGFLRNSTARIAAAATKALFKWAMNSLGGKGGAIVSYARSFLGKIPYRFGGTGLTADDCSGFTQAIYGKFGIKAPRTSESQYAWATKSGPVPGALAFYVSPAGGPPPGHVAIVQDARSVISQGGPEGVKGPRIMGLHDMPLMGTGVPKGGLPVSAGGAGNAAAFGGSTPGTMSAGAIAALWRLMGGPGYAASNMARIAFAESGDRPGAIQRGQPPGLTGWGLYQITPTSGIWQNGRFGNLLNASNNTRAAISLFNVSGYSPWVTASALGLGPQGPHAQGGLIRKLAGGRVPGYANGTPSAAPGWGVVGENGPELVRFGGGEKVIPGMAAGGRIPLGKYLSQLRKAQGSEYHDYLGLRKAYLDDLAHAKKGSWTSGHRASIRGVLGTLAKRQSLEEAGYDNILHHGTAKANLSRFRTRVSAVRTSTRTKTLSHSHPSWLHGLQHWLGVLTHLSQADVAPVYGGSQAKLQFPAWLAKARAAQSREVYDFRGLEGAFKVSLRHARKGTWLYQNRKALGERLYAVAVRQKAEAAAWNDLIRHSSGSVSDLGGLAVRIGRLGTRARAEAGSLQPALLGHLPGGHPGWVKGLQAQLKILASLTARPPFNPPWAPGSLGPSHTAVGGVLRFAGGGMVPVRSFDSGGLWPSGTLGWNGSGRTETVTPGGGGDIHIHVHNEGVIGSQHETDTWLTSSVNRLARTGYLSQAVSQARR